MSISRIHPPRSIRARMTAAFTLAIAALMLLACGGLAEYAQYSAESRADLLLNAAAEKLGEDLAEHKHSLNLSEVTQEEREELLTNDMIMLVVDARGRIVDRSRRNVPPWPQVREHWRMVTIRVGADTVVLALPWTETARLLRRQAWALSGLGLFVTLMAAVGAWLLVGRTLSPIGSLSRQAQAASAHRLGLQLTAPSQDNEIVELVATLNGLLARLSETAAAKGRFYAAASHELRTPLQALSGHLEVALYRNRTNAEYRATVEEAFQQTSRLIALVRDLLLLNQLELASVASSQEGIDLTEVCDHILCQFEPLADQSRLHVHRTLQTAVEILAPPLHAQMLVRNVIENAVKYATPEGIVSVQLSGSPTGARLEVFNECRLPESLDPKQLFEPFFRPDASRNSETGGNGLGLAICHAIAVANGWKLDLLPEPSGIRMTVLFSENIHRQCTGSSKIPVP